MKTIRDVMQPDPIQIEPDTTIHRALELLVENQISGLPVVDKAGKLVGVLSEKDLLSVFYEPDAHNVEPLMSRNPVAVAVDAPLVDVIDLLMANDFRRVFVQDEGKLVGLISRSDLMPAILHALLERT